MPKKKVTIAVKPKAPTAPTIEQWVGNPDPRTAPAETPEEESEPMKRLTLDIPASLHRIIKIGCVERDVKMVEDIRALLEQHYRKQE